MPVINRSIMSENALRGVVCSEYGLPENSLVSFWRTGIAGNDVYHVDTGTNKYLLKIYFVHADAAQIEASLEIMEYLGSKGICVPHVYRSQNNQIRIEISYPEGTRSAVLLDFLAGEEPNLFDLEDGRKIGEMVGKMYQALDSYHPQHPLRKIDDAYLVKSAITGLRNYQKKEVEKIEYLEAAGKRLWNVLVQTIPASGPTYGICHGDLHTGNMIKAESGEIYLFDFDSCGYGYRIFDIGICANKNWMAKTRDELREDIEALKIFESGFNAVRSITPDEEAVFPCMLGLRHLELLGVVLRNCVILEGRHWISGNLNSHVDWFTEWQASFEE